MLVTDVAKGGTADKTGLKPLDVILEIGGQTVAAPADLAAVAARMRVGYKAA